VDSLDAFFDEAFGADGARVWVENPALAEPPLDVFIYPPRAERRFFTLVTGGVSTAALNVPSGREHLQRIELVMYVTPEWSSPDTSADQDDRTWPLELLRTLGRFVHQRQTFFRPGDTIPNATEPPTPYAPSTLLASALILPLPEFDAALSPMQVDDLEITLLRVVPITVAEHALKLREGSNEILRRFRERGVSIAVDLARASVV
jgi:hypothetical protein